MVSKKQKILQNYPFEKLSPPVVLVEGCKAYDGAIGDEPGKPHKGIDFVRKKGKKYLSFDVFSSQDGKAFQGLSETWGKFVSVRQEITDSEAQEMGMRLLNFFKLLIDIDRRIKKPRV